MRRLLLALGLLLAVSVFAGAAHVLPAHALDIPPHGGQWVVDTARLLPPAEKNALAESLRSYAEQTGTQIVVLTIPGLQGEDLTAYANRVAREWGVGQKDKNNGVLILVAAAERKVRFEVGRGIEDRLPDLRAKRIQQEITVPHFKAGRYGPGLVASVAAIRQALGDGQGAGEGVPAELQAGPQPRPAPTGGFPLLTVGLLVVAGLLALAFFRRNASRFGGGGSSRYGGGDNSFFLGLLLGILSSIFRGRGGGGGGFGGGGGGDGGFSGGGGDFGGGGSSSDFGGDDN